jgi:integrase/recombinase XerD
MGSIQPAASTNALPCKRETFTIAGAECAQKIIIRKSNTKGKLATRTIPVIEDLRIRLQEYRPPQPKGFLFPGRHGSGHLHPDSASWILRSACRRVGIEGVSTHSFRRTALTQMSNAGIPLRIIQEISGHRTLDELYKYLDSQPRTGARCDRRLVNADAG